MLKMDVQEIIDAVSGNLYIDGKCYEYSHITTDTRKLVKGSIFVALKGDNFNGNNYIIQASKQGALICIIDEICFDVADLEVNTTIIKVEDTKKALQDLAKYYKSKLKIKIIGVTGSTGKTSTKDIIAAVLSTKLKVFKTKGNFNNNIGLPLMIFELDDSYDVAVLEMGMNNLNEIHALTDIARPDIAVITNIGVSHMENLKSRDNILRAKLEITDFFSENNTLIVNGENDLLCDLQSSKYNVIKVGINKEFAYTAINTVSNENNVIFNIKENGMVYDKIVSVPLPGRHSILNSLLAIACARLIGLSLDEIIEGITKIDSTSRRLEIIRTEKYTIIDDCYNASPDSMRAAIDVMTNMNGNKKVAILGTMKELGSEAYQLHKEIGIYAKENGVDRLITVGEFNEAYKEGYSCNEHFKGFNNTSDAGEFAFHEFQPGDIILIKASRSMKFETIVEALKFMITSDRGETAL